jgi:amino acid adenylation domain-containing protein
MTSSISGTLADAVSIVTSGAAAPSSLPTAAAGVVEVKGLGEYDTSAYFAAWCALRFRHAEQDQFSVEVLGYTGGEWEGRVLDVGVAGDDAAHELRGRLESRLARVEETYPAASRERQSLGFSELAEWPEQGMPAQAICRELHLVLAGAPGARRCHILFDRRCFSPASVQRMAEQFRPLVAAFSARVPALVRNLPLLDDVETERLRTAWSGRAMAEPAALVCAEFERRAHESPDAVAVSIGANKLTYGALNRMANRLARWLGSQGVQRGGVVGICVEPCLEFVACMLAAFKTGATHLPLDPGYPIDRLALILEDTAPALVITQRALTSRLPALLPRLVCVEELDELTRGLADDDPGYPVSADDIAYIVYTSGTTGKPKGVLATHGNLAHYIRVARDAYGYGPRDVIPAMARFTFSITFFELLCPLTSGARLVLLERAHVLDMALMAKTLQEITCIHASPSLWRRVLAYLDEHNLSGPAFRNLRHASSGGDMVPPDVLESLKRVFPDAEIFVIYGCSEVSCMGCTYAVPRDRTLTSTRVGVPFPDMTLRLLDGDDNLVPPGVIGEVCFGGAGLVAGYLNTPNLTAKKFTEWRGERVYHTGDLGRVDAEGNLELIGRSDFQIKLRGIRIEPAEIEAAIRAVDGVKDALVAAPMMPDGERRLVAYVVPEPASPPPKRALRERLKTKLPDYMLPSHYVFLAALPVTFNNKVDRLALSQATGIDLASGEASDPPRTETERRLLQIWQEVLGVNDIGVRDEFFDVGGDSLRSLTVMATLDKRMGVVLPVSSLLTHPTVERLAAVIDGRGAATGGSTLVCLRRGDGSRPPIFLVHDGDGETMPYRNLALRMHRGHTVYGIHPKSDAEHPILHTRISDMVDFYIEQIRAVQPRGPYFLGGLCIGGFLSFEVGRKLKSQGEVVGPIALIDVAHVTTPPRSVTARRMSHLSSALRDVPSTSPLYRGLALARTAARRALNMVEYETRTRLQRRKIRLKLQLLRYCLDHGMVLPPFVRHVSVDATLRFAEKEYIVPVPYTGDAILFRATRPDPALYGIVNDTPYIDVFEDPMLGWSDIVTVLNTYDVAAGHSSMLQEPRVALVAETLQEHIDRTLGIAPVEAPLALENSPPL